MSKKELNELSEDELYERQEELEQQIEYEESKLEVCGYGKSDLYYLDQLYAELEKINEKIREI